MALVPPRQLAISREPAANASVCLAPDVISGNVTFTPSFSKPLTIVPLFLSTILGIFSGALTYVTRSSVTGAAAFLAGSLPPQPVTETANTNRERQNSNNFVFIFTRLLLVSFLIYIFLPYLSYAFYCNINLPPGQIHFRTNNATHLPEILSAV